MAKKKFVEFADFYKNADAMLKELAKGGDPIHLMAANRARATLVSTEVLERTVDDRETFRQVLLALAQAAEAGDKKAVKYLLEFVKNLKL